MAEVSLALALLVAPALATASAAAQPLQTEPNGCDAVVDVSGLLAPDELATVGQAAAELAERHALVLRVRLLAATDAGIDAWFDDRLAACPTWQTGFDGRDPRLLVAAVSLGDRRTGTWWGSELGVLEARYLGVHDQAAPALRRGDHAAALVTLLDGYDAVLVGPSVTVPVGEPSGGLPAPTTPTTPPQPLLPSDDGIGAGELAWGAGGVAATGATVGGFWYAARRRRRRELGTRIARLRDEARGRYQALDQRWDELHDAALLARGHAADDDSLAIAVADEQSQAAVVIERATVDLLAADRQDPVAPLRTDETELEAVEQRWRSVGEGLDALGAELDDVERAVAALRDAAESAPADLAAHPEARRRADDALAEIEAAGYFVADFRTRLDHAAAAHARGEELLAARRPGDAAPLASAARSAADAVAAEAVDLPARRERLEARIDQARRELVEVETIADDVDRRLEILRSRYAASAVDSYGPVEAAVHDAVADARVQLDAAVTGVSMTVQAFDEVSAAGGRFDRDVEVVRAGASALADLETELEQATAAVPAAIATARADLAETESFLTAHHGDVDPGHQSVVARAVQHLDEADEAAAAPLPDPRRALHRARDASAVLDRVLATARTEHAAREAARDRARSAIRDAQAAVASARRHDGFGLFGWSARAHASLAGADAELRRAADLVGDEPERARAVASAVEADANQIVREARQRSANGGGGLLGASVGGSSSRSSFGSFGSSGGSGSSGGRSGGGSSSFGGSGGGSSGW